LVKPRALRDVLNGAGSPGNLRGQHAQADMTNAEAIDTHTPIAERARQFAPVVWLLGKVQSGKTSIVRELTQASTAEIGNGYEACTRTARVFDFPPEAPIIRFLDTRGLGEVAYDPAEDIAFCEGRAHLVLVVMKALDFQQGAVIEAVRAARRRHPDWPVVVAQTSLHEAYPPGSGHVLPYPFGAEKVAAEVPPDLLRALHHQRSLFSAVPGKGELRFVPIDFTQAGDGFEPSDYGREALIEALLAAAPAAVATVVAQLAPHGESVEANLNSHILGFAFAAGASDAFPLAGMVAVPVVQAAMLRHIAVRLGMTWDRRAAAEFAGALGAGTLVRVASGFGVRQLVKLIPVYGQTAGAAAAATASFAATYAMGKAAAYFLRRRRAGERGEEVLSVYRAALKRALRLASERDIATAASGGER
jgi:uncharacterized protein (DUF697 family)